MNENGFSCISARGVTNTELFMIGMKLSTNPKAPNTTATTPQIVRG